MLLGGRAGGARMPSAAAMVVVVGGLVAAGLALSFYGSSLIADDMEQRTGAVGGGEGPLSVSVMLEPYGEGRGGGVYVVQVIDYEEGAGIHAVVTGPSGEELDQAQLDGPSHEGYFEVDAPGSYTLLVEGSGADSIGAVAIIGQVPPTERLAVGITGFYLVVAGLAGMAVVAVIAVRGRMRRGRGAP